jgi:hypothetical protein
VVDLVSEIRSARSETSVRNGMNGCSRMQIWSMRNATVRRVSSLAGPSSPWSTGFTEELWAIKGREAGLDRGLLVLSRWPDLAALARPEAGR